MGIPVFKSFHKLNVSYVQVVHPTSLIHKHSVRNTIEEPETVESPKNIKHKDGDGAPNKRQMDGRE